MSKNKNLYCSVSFLILFLFTFCFQNILTLVNSPLLQKNISLLDKTLKVFSASPEDQGNYEDNSLFENESEDEVKNEIEATEIILPQIFTYFSYVKQTILKECINHNVNPDNDPIYISIRILRI
jgi:hypothetical protein